MSSASSSSSAALSVQIRPFCDADYAAYTLIHNATFADNPEVEEQLRHYDKSKPDRVRMARFVAECRGRVVGIGGWTHSFWSFHPKRFYVSVWVLPEFQQRGVGQQLWQRVMDSLLEFEPEAEKVRVTAREDWDRSLRIAGQAGFVEEFRSFESRLDLTAFDLDRWQAAETRPWTGSLRLTTLGQFLAANPTDGWERVYALDVEAGKDVPYTEPIVGMPWESWVTMIRDNPKLLPEGVQLAIDGDKLVGMSALWDGSEDGVIETGLTGVLRSHRRRGVATGLKLAGIRFAIENGYREVRTDNATTNRPMLSINEALGYVKQPAWVEFVKLLGDE